MRAASALGVVIVVLVASHMPMLGWAGETGDPDQAILQEVEERARELRQSLEPAAVPSPPQSPRQSGVTRTEVQQQMQEQMQREMRQRMQPLVESEMPLQNEPGAPPEDRPQATPQEIRQERQQRMQQEMQQRMQGSYRSEIESRVSGVPPAVLARQSSEPVEVPALGEAVAAALAAAAGEAQSLLAPERAWHGRVIRVPEEHRHIQAAVDAARPGDTVLVRPGTYREQLEMRSGVRLASDPSDRGDELVAVEGAMLQLPRRALRTIIDGTGFAASEHGMLDFAPGAGRDTVVDGFTIQSLPVQNHHLPGHAHGVNIRGASPVITNCLVRNMGSTGIGSHVIYRDQEAPMPERDFRQANIRQATAAVIYHNIVHGNLGLGIGCNHFAAPFILGNEVFGNNDESLGERTSPGIGIKHGAAPRIVGNIVHDNAGGGILSSAGEAQGRHPVDQAAHPTVERNVVFRNGSRRPGIGGHAVGSLSAPMTVAGNLLFEASATGIALESGTVGVVEDNLVAGSREPAIVVSGSTALALNRNRITGVADSPGILIFRQATVQEMAGNAVDRTTFGPRFRVEAGSTVVAPGS
ncbi:MAG: right-handed parallel beta-helix repeat-containing protein [Thermodesulfobacteriota bacterium]